MFIIRNKYVRKSNSRIQNGYRKNVERIKRHERQIFQTEKENTRPSIIKSEITRHNLKNINIRVFAIATIVNEIQWWWF